jgi:hypothetical protein
MLHSPEAHEALAGDAWDAEVARAAIRAIVADCESALDPDGMWPFHPRDGVDEGPYTTVYLGAAGVIFGLAVLERRGLIEMQRDYAPILERHAETYRAAPEFDEWGAHPPSFWMGETGILATLQLLRPTPGGSGRIAELVDANVVDTHREFMWGSPGTMLAARWIDRDDLWQQSADRLRADWDEESGLWTQDLYGAERRFLGPAHGFAGCVNSLAAQPDEDLHRRASATFRRYAIEEDGHANWPAVEDVALDGSGDGLIRLQWCHGAPGMVACLAAIAPNDDEHERLLVAGGELVWLAGPLAKGANLCHGTAGNGLAFLKLFERTGDERWLDRARAFAMHSIAQVARERREVGRGRYSLWTGDPGTALYVGLCLEGETALPGFDV